MDGAASTGSGSGSGASSGGSGSSGGGSSSSGGSTVGDAAGSSSGSDASGSDSGVTLPPGLFGNWPTGSAPTDIGTRVVQNFLARTLGFESNPATAVTYQESIGWYGSLQFTKLSGNATLDGNLITKFAPLLTAADAALIPSADNVDSRVFGIVPLEIFLHNMGAQYLQMGQGLADKQWANTTSDGITTEARYWVDDTFMITSLQVQAYRATGTTTYLDRAANTLVAYINKIQQPNGLFWHTQTSKIYWGRGNGWAATGMSEILRSMPASHPQRAAIMAGYTKLMAALLQNQTSAGMWRQVIDNTSATPETSCTGMFTFAFVTGVKNGWLDATTYGPAARSAWPALIGYLDSQANMKNVCTGTGDAFSQVGSDPTAQLNYYLNRPLVTGDLHGQAPVLWSASALLR